MMKKIIAFLVVLTMLTILVVFFTAQEPVPGLVDRPQRPLGWISAKHWLDAPEDARFVLNGIYADQDSTTPLRIHVLLQCPETDAETVGFTKPQFGSDAPVQTLSFRLDGSNLLIGYISDRVALGTDIYAPGQVIFVRLMNETGETMTAEIQNRVFVVAVPETWERISEISFFRRIGPDEEYIARTILTDPINLVADFFRPVFYPFSCVDTVQ